MQGQFGANETSWCEQLSIARAKRRFHHHGVHGGEEISHSGVLTSVMFAGHNTKKFLRVLLGPVNWQLQLIAQDAPQNLP